MVKTLLFITLPVFCVRDPFVYAYQETNDALATARLHDDQKSVHFLMNNNQELQIALQEKSPSTLYKAEGLGG